MKLMESKQTAVEWLVEKIQQANPTFKFDALIREAKAMELAQRIDDYTNGHIDREKNLFRLPKRNTSSLPIDEDMTDWDVTLNDGLENL